jgi:hypothetical protein
MLLSGAWKAGRKFETSIFISARSSLEEPNSISTGNHMNNHIDLDDLTKKTKRLEYEDGLRDFQIGAIFLILFLANWFIFTPAGLELLIRTSIRFKDYKDLWLVGLVGLIALIYLLAFGSERVMERIRRATFWKESGFVKPLRWGVIPKGVVILATVVLLGIIIGSVWLMSRGILSQDAALRSVPASTGLATAVFFISLGNNLQIRRYVIVGVSGAILSGIILITEMAFATAYLWTGVGWAVILALSGFWALRWALRDLRQETQNG